MKYIKSNPNEGGGIGHQWMNWFTGLVMSEMWGYGFVHTPLISSRSGGNWDDFLNFGKGYKTINQVNLPTYDLPDLDIGMDVSKEEGLKNLKKIKEEIENGPDNRVYSLSYNTFPGVVAEKLWLVVDELRTKYREVHSVPENDRFTVSFHLRRGDVNPNQNPGRWAGNEYYIDWIKKLRKILIEEGGYGNPKMVLFSTTGQTGEFSDFPSYVERRIDGDPFEDFHYMVCSDLLFAGLSSYSILAAALNTNFCYYFPLQTYCDWMENEKNPYKDRYSNVYNENFNKLKSWLDEYK